MLAKPIQRESNAACAAQSRSADQRVNADGREHRSRRRHLHPPPPPGRRRHRLAADVGVGGWAATTELSGAVIAPGSIVVDSNVKKVQHLTGGIVGELLVRDGERVQRGEVVAAARRDHHAGQSRHRHQGPRRDERAPGPAREPSATAPTHIAFPSYLLARANDPTSRAAIDSERKLFELRRSARLGKKSQLRERIAQLDEEIRGLHGAAGGKSGGDRADPARARRRAGAVEQEPGADQRLISLEREAARLEGERGAARSPRWPSHAARSPRSSCRSSRSTRI